MSEELLAHEFVGFDGPLDVIAVDADCNPHKKVLRTLGNSTVHTKEIRVLEGFEAKTKSQLARKTV